MGGNSVYINTGGNSICFTILSQGSSRYTSSLFLKLCHKFTSFSILPSPSASSNPLIPPIELPQIMFGRTPLLYRYCRAPAWKSPRVPPAPSTIAIIIIPPYFNSMIIHYLQSYLRIMPLRRPSNN